MLKMKKTHRRSSCPQAQGPASGRGSAAAATALRSASSSARFKRTLPNRAYAGVVSRVPSNRSSVRAWKRRRLYAVGANKSSEKKTIEPTVAINKVENTVKWKGSLCMNFHIAGRCSTSLQRQRALHCRIIAATRSDVTGGACGCEQPCGNACGPPISASLDLAEAAAQEDYAPPRLFHGAKASVLSVIDAVLAILCAVTKSVSQSQQLRPKSDSAARACNASCSFAHMCLGVGTQVSC